MKKLMSILLGLSLVIGATAFAQGEKDTTKKTGKKSKKAKKTAEPK